MNDVFETCDLITQVRERTISCISVILLGIGLVVFPKVFLDISDAEKIILQTAGWAAIIFSSYHGLYLLLELSTRNTVTLRLNNQGILINSSVIAWKSIDFIEQDGGSVVLHLHRESYGKIDTKSILKNITDVYADDKTIRLPLIGYTNSVKDIWENFENFFWNDKV